MPIYTIESGDFKTKITTIFRAEETALCVMALVQWPAKKGKALGRVMQVTGGQYRDSGVIFLSTKSVLGDMGGHGIIWLKNLYLI